MLQKLLSENLGDEDCRVIAIRHVPGNIARVTFELPDGKKYYEPRNQVTISDIGCPVVPPPSPVRWSTVMVYGYPYNVPNNGIKSALLRYGDVDEIRFQHWVGLPGVSTTNRLVRMKHTKEIPRWINVNGINVKVWYKGQPVVCDICQSNDHKAADCPKKGRYRICNSPEHFAKDCKNCRRCGSADHITRFCMNAWGSRPSEDVPPQPSRDDVDAVGSADVPGAPHG